jgi:hypothetical protein
MSALSTGDPCSGKKDFFLQTITCSQHETVTVNGTYGNKKHVHEYDDKFDVTGVNMLAASDPAFNLSNVPASTMTDSTPFKVLVMNQYLNPAATLAVGPAATQNGVRVYESVKTYNNLASTSAADAATLIAALPTYTRASIGTFTFNLPLDAFQSKDWWGDGAPARAGLIPTQTGCVNKPSATGVSNHPGAQMEPADGALVIQIIKDGTPADALMLNVPGDPKYGWRVKPNDATFPYFTAYVLAEYTVFWHHPNGKCYGDAGWVQNAPQDFQGAATAQTPAVGSSDPKDGIFGAGGGSPTSPTVVKVVTNNDGSTTTTYSDGTVVITYPDGSTKTTLPDGTVVWSIPGVDTGGVVSSIGGIELGGVTTPPEILGRINWRQLGR